MLTFDAPAHHYFWNGVRVPNVTSILAPLTDYSKIPRGQLERARQQGIAVHKMVELDCKGDLDTDALPEWMAGHFAAWEKFKAEIDFELWSSEQPVYHKGMSYAGTLDLTGMPCNLKHKDAALIDVKRSFYAGPVIGLQLAAYEKARNDSVEKALRTKHRFALRLDVDGQYRLEAFEDRNDFTVFTACLALHRWKERHERT